MVHRGAQFYPCPYQTLGMPGRETIISSITADRVRIRRGQPQGHDGSEIHQAASAVRDKSAVCVAVNMKCPVCRSGRYDFSIFRAAICLTPGRGCVFWPWSWSSIAFLLVNACGCLTGDDHGQKLVDRQRPFHPRSIRTGAVRTRSPRGSGRCAP